MNEKETVINNPKLTIIKRQNVSGGAYGLGFIGALIYLLQNAHTFWAVVVSFFEALVWPAMLVYHLFKFFKL